MTARHRTAAFGPGCARALLAALVACQHPAAPAPPRPRPPTGEVWLTPSEVANLALAIEPVAVHAIHDTIRTGGRVAFDDAEVTHVFSPVSGRITHIAARLGAHVARGAPLATLLAPDIGIASSDLAKAEADEVVARQDRARALALVQQGAGAAREFEAADAVWRRAVAERERAQQRVRLMRGGAGGGSVDAVSQTYTLRAELDGEVVARMANPGVEVQGQYSGGTPFELFTIGNLDHVWVLADVFEMDLARVHLGSRVHVHVVAYPQRAYAGQIDWIAGTLDPQTRTVRIRCSLDNADRALRPEMFATVEVEVDAPPALAIPRNALLRLGESTYVFARRGDAPGGRTAFARVAVEVDAASGEDWLPLTRGPAAGTPIVTDNAIQLVGML